MTFSKLQNNSSNHNGSGYADPTYKEVSAHMSQVLEKEKNERHADYRFHSLLKVLYYIINQSGFVLEGRIQLRDKKTGKSYY